MSKVKIQGNASGTGVLTVEAPNTNTDRTITLPDSTGTLVDDTTAVTKDASGNVGIGVTPENWFGVYNALQLGRDGSIAGQTNDAGLMVSSNAYVNGSNVDSYISADFASQHLQRNGVHTFNVAPSGTADSAISWTNAMTIDNSGRTLIGCSSTATKMRVHNGTDTAPIIRLGTNFTSGTFTVMQFVKENTSDGSSTAGTQIGTITCTTSSTSYNTSSDYRLKENVVPMTGSIDRLKALKPSRFNFIADADTTVDGFLAHEAGEVVPEAVTGEKDAMRTEEYEVTPAVMDGDTVVTEAVMGEREVEDYQGIDQSKLVPLLTSALQEAVAKIEALETRVTQLENV